MLKKITTKYFPTSIITTHPTYQWLLDELTEVVEE